MAVIARRTLLALLFTTSTEDDIRNVLASMATDLSAGNISGFLNLLAKDFPAPDELRQQLVGLTTTYDVNSSVQVQTATGTEEKQSAKVDWYLALRSRTDNAVAQQRREVLTIEFIKRNKRWRVTSISPISFFAQNAL